MLQADKEITEKIPKGTRLYWVNSEISQTSSGGQIFANKDLTPDSLGLAGQQLNSANLIRKTTSALEAKYPEGNTAEQLIKLLHLADTKSSSVSLSDIEFENKDLAKVSADFGEILSAIWAMKTLRFREVFFPSASNEALIDFYGVRMGYHYPISVKSGGGGKVTIQNLPFQQDIANMAGTSRETVSRVLKILENKSMISKEGHTLIIPDYNFFKQIFGKTL